MPADTLVIAPAPAVIATTPPVVAPPPPAAVASEDHDPEASSMPPAVSPADAERLGNRIAALASRIHAATHE
ncbi:MAG: hypothetical protein OXH04_06560, partial [Acidobacteria bacterium]|nr:hypothetical protein [Acidobacteriota bacterium]